MSPANAGFFAIRAQDPTAFAVGYEYAASFAGSPNFPRTIAGRG
jgi:hypothetical protein